MIRDPQRLRMAQIRRLCKSKPRDIDTLTGYLGCSKTTAYKAVVTMLEEKRLRQIKDTWPICYEVPE